MLDQRVIILVIKHMVYFRHIVTLVFLEILNLFYFVNGLILDFVELLSVGDVVNEAERPV